MDNPLLAEDSFGDCFDIAALPLPRPPAGYAVQMLDTDQLLDRNSGNFLPVRSPELRGLFDSFHEARVAALAWVEKHCPPPEEHRLAIVPAGYDQFRERHVLIYGVLCTRP